MLAPNLWSIPPIDEKTLLTLPEKESQLQLRLRDIAARHHNIKLAHSLSVEDFVITDQIAKLHLPIELLVLDTKALPDATLQLLKTAKKYYSHLTWLIESPDESRIEYYRQTRGEHAFYENIQWRQECCFIRKIEPLNRALSQADAWLTGQRREQSSTRQHLAFQEHDSARNIAKFNPLFDWQENEVWAYIQKNNIPFNELYKQGYPSIGCAPCSKPVKKGEDIRAGRWWWEQKEQKECGLHMSQKAA